MPLVVGRRHEDLHGCEGAAADGLTGEDPEPGLDLVQPAGAFLREVEVDVRMGVQPGIDVRGGVGGQAVQHHMNLAAGVRATAFFRKAAADADLRLPVGHPLVGRLVNGDEIDRHRGSQIGDCTDGGGCAAVLR